MTAHGLRVPSCLNAARPSCGVVMRGRGFPSAQSAASTIVVADRELVGGGGGGGGFGALPAFFLFFLLFFSLHRVCGL
eukprot:SAG31_NODE_4197_length_3483_cov_1.755319_1_plen_77_part_10